MDNSSASKNMLDGWPRYLLWLVGVTSIVNGIAMYFTPGDWFTAVPGVPETGPFNGHFVRDVGAAYVMTGVAVILAVRLRPSRLPLLVVASLFSGGHAARHVVEWITVEATHQHWMSDAAGVVLPALVILGATAVALKEN